MIVEVPNIDSLQARIIVGVSYHSLQYGPAHFQLSLRRASSALAQRILGLHGAASKDPEDRDLPRVVSRPDISSAGVSPLPFPSLRRSIVHGLFAPFSGLAARVESALRRGGFIAIAARSQKELG